MVVFLFGSMEPGLKRVSYLVAQYENDPVDACFSYY